MKQEDIIAELAHNKRVLQGLLESLPRELYSWKTSPNKWCLLEIVCHLYDEEKEDFRARTKQALEDPMAALTPINPEGWVKERDYLGQDFNSKVAALLQERSKSIGWLTSLENPNWDNFFVHPELGEMSANLFLSNWLAHDYLHIRQINRLKFEYLKAHTSLPLEYAGKW